MLGTVTTAADGSWSFTWRPLHNFFRTYATWPQGNTAAGIRFMGGIAWTQRTNVQVRVALAALPTTVTAGAITPIAGSVAPDKAGRVVYLQRWTRSGWSSVARATIRLSGRFTLAAQPAVSGTYSYRVYKAGDAQTVGLTTRAFSIRAT